jgi:two-component system phosphate regulon sensor histidine kinase PhoR
MWSSRLFWKLFLAYAGLILAPAALLAALVSAQQKDQVVAHLRDRLHAEAVVLRSHVAADLAAERHEGLQELTDRLGRQTGTRLTIIAADAAGTVWADSEQDPAQMEPHGDRPEVAEARTRGVGIRDHISRTLGIPMMYLAMRIDDQTGNPIGFVRVALPLKTVEAQIAARQQLVWAISLVVGLATLAVTYVVVGRITRPVQSLIVAADAIAQGEYGQTVHVPNRDELGSLGTAFNRMSAELAARVSQIRGDQELLATVLGGMIEGVVAVDAAERVQFANGAARDLLGLGNANLAGRPIWELVRHGAMHEVVREAFASERPCRLEVELASSTRRVVAVHASRLPGDPSPGVVLVLHEMTELRRLETLRRDFVANVSHELKTPLSSIRAYAETLLNGALDDPEHRTNFVRQIEEQSTRLQSLILDLLSLARIESGQEAFEIVPLSVAEVAQACISRHHAAATAKGVALELQSSDDSLQVLADDEGMREILDNLVDNAVKYTPEGGRVAIRWRRDGSTGVIDVEDTGIGIAPHDQARVFERFYRVDKARSRELGGTGLGLSIVKHLAQAFGGTVSVSSEVGRRSTFSVQLPLA